MLMGQKPFPYVADPLIDHSRQVTMLCDCPDKSPVCKHMVAVAMEFSKRLSSDPMEILRFRGINPKPFIEKMEKAEQAAKDTSAAVGRGDAEVRDIASPREEQEHTVDADEFWGRKHPPVAWQEVAVEEGHELGEQEQLMQAIDTVSWTHVDQLETRHVIDRCYEELGLAEPLFAYSRRMSEAHEINEDITTGEDDK